jgi:thiol-disulfide isomerase/thioredoxin
MSSFIGSQHYITIKKIMKITLSAVFVLLLLNYTGILNGTTESDDATIEKTFDYDFHIKDLNGKSISVTDFKDKVVFLNIWATWCGPCRTEMPSIQSLYDKTDHSKVVFIMLSLDEPQNLNKVTKYIQEKNFQFPVYLSEGSLPKQLQVSIIPSTFIIGKDGKIKLKKTGMEDYDTEEYKKFLDDLAAL